MSDGFSFSRSTKLYFIWDYRDDCPCLGPHGVLAFVDAETANKYRNRIVPKRWKKRMRVRPCGYAEWFAYLLLSICKGVDWLDVVPHFGATIEHVSIYLPSLLAPFADQEVAEAGGDHEAAFEKVKAAYRAAA